MAAQAIGTRDFHVFILVLDFFLNISYTYCGEFHLILILKGGYLLILTVCAMGI